MAQFLTTAAVVNNCVIIENKRAIPGNSSLQSQPDFIGHTQDKRLGWPPQSLLFAYMVFRKQSERITDPGSKKTVETEALNTSSLRW